MPLPGPTDLARWATAARRHETPCGAGRLVWRSWGGGRPVVLLHGGHGSWNHWLRNLEALTAAGHAVWAPDLPGMGESDLPNADGGPWTPQQVADILASGLATLIPAGQFDLAGFSFGGMIAGHLADRHPGRVRQLVLVGAAAMGMTSEAGIRMRNWRKAGSDTERLAMHRHNLLEHMLPDPAMVDDFAVAMQAANVEADRLRHREPSRGDNLFHALKTVRCPVHALWGVDDALYRANRHALDAALRAVGATSILFVGNCGHWVQYQKADWFNRVLLELLGPDAAG